MRYEARRLVLASLAALAAACGSDVPTAPSPPPDTLPATPTILSPATGSQVTTDTPTLTVRNARGFDLGQATYTFRVHMARADRELQSVSVPAGSGSTSVTLPEPLPRGGLIAWEATAASSTGSGSVVSETATLQPPAVACLSVRGRYAKSVVDWFVPRCSLAQNIYNDPAAVLGPPDAGGLAPDMYFGFMSLGDGGHVTVDMESCAVDGQGVDVRVYQSVSQEPVTLYAGGARDGPFVLVRSRKPCGNDLSGVFSNFCDFDLASAGLDEARYLRVEDGELYPCPGDTVTEGADIDAVELIHRKP